MKRLKEWQEKKSKMTEKKVTDVKLVGNDKKNKFGRK